MVSYAHIMTEEHEVFLVCTSPNVRKGILYAYQSSVP